MPTGEPWIRRLLEGPSASPSASELLIRMSYCLQDDTLVSKVQGVKRTKNTCMRSILHVMRQVLYSKTSFVSIPFPLKCQVDSHELW